MHPLQHDDNRGFVLKALGKHHKAHYETIQETLQKQVAAQASTFQVTVAESAHKLQL